MMPAAVALGDTGGDSHSFGRGAHGIADGGAQHPRGWRDLTPDLIARIASYAHPNDVAGGLKLLNVEAAACLRKHRRLSLAAPPQAWPLHDLPPRAQQPWPRDAFARHWGRPEPWRVLNLRERRRLLCLAASSGHAASLDAALAHCGCALDVHPLESAAAAGDVAACSTLLSAGCEWGQSVFAAAAAAGHLPVCQSFWDAGLRPPPVRNSRSAVVEAACRGGHARVLQWFEEVGFVRLLLAPEPQPAGCGPSDPGGSGAHGSGSAAAGTAAGTARPAPDARYYLHAFATVMAASRGHSALLRRLLDFGRGRYDCVPNGGACTASGAHGASGANGIKGGGGGGAGGSNGGGGGGGLLDGVARPHREALLAALAFGGTAEEFAAAYDEQPLFAAPAGNGGLALGEHDCAALLQQAAGSPRPDGSWADKVEFILLRLRQRTSGEDAAADSGWAPALEAERDGLWSVWEGVAKHPDSDEVERRMRFFVAKGFQPGPGALKVAVASGSVGALRFLLDECGLALTPEVGDQAARCGRLGVIQMLQSRGRLRIDEQLVTSALMGVRGAGMAGTSDVNYGAVYANSGAQHGTGTEAMPVLRCLVQGLMTAGGGGGGGEASGSGSGGGGERAGYGGLAEGVDLCSGRAGSGRSGLLPASPAPRVWVHLLGEACRSGVSDIDLLAGLLLRTGLSVRPAAAAAAGAAADGDDSDRRRTELVSYVVLSMLAAGSEAAVRWAARRLRAVCWGPVPSLTPDQLWTAALGGNFAAIRAACDADLGRMPDWLPDCAYEVDWLRRREERQAQERERAARRAAGRVLCGLAGVLRRVWGQRGAGEGGDAEVAGPERQ
ncbi:hypothetical protein HXX76_010521 [Chlamydomonas incerta]|uniref:Ankyrin repeat domain-containing protein n=1 Tax=Chlamydomonas incerta TaxID=51695 RepID=A0A835SQZ5_CHLIN|nr:hypothetical protein HXX76_010521 [Chlamydomonas incerta]|eukprot:KAG2429737.1 hypothetical protein HXX76_010521 [Chlamydomonas incerta]